MTSNGIITPAATAPAIWGEGGRGREKGERRGEGERRGREKGEGEGERGREKGEGKKGRGRERDDVIIIMATP